MDALVCCRSYLDALNRKSTSDVLELFTPDATVQAPISGTRDVRSFHVRLFAGSRRAIARLVRVFTSQHDDHCIALQFSYTWVLKGGSTVILDGVKVFEMDDARQLFRKLTIIYDPTELRRHLSDAEIESTPLD